MTAVPKKPTCMSYDIDVSIGSYSDTSVSTAFFYNMYPLASQFLFTKVRERLLINHDDLEVVQGTISCVLMSSKWLCNDLNVAVANSETGVTCWSQPKTGSHSMTCQFLYFHSRFGC